MMDSDWLEIISINITTSNKSSTCAMDRYTGHGYLVEVKYDIKLTEIRKKLIQQLHEKMDCFHQ